MEQAQTESHPAFVMEKKKLVKIKSPHWLQSASDLSVLEYLGADSDGKYYLKEKSSYYMQVQGQMALLGLNLCDFVNTILKKSQITICIYRARWLY